MKVDLFGTGTQSASPAITAQQRINCFVELRREGEKTRYAIIGRPGMTSFVSTLGANPTRGMWAVNSLATPLLFVVQGATLYSIDNAGSSAIIGTIGTSAGDVSLTDDGTYLVLVDGSKGYYYNMIAPAGLVAIVSGNFTASPSTVTWQDTYFIVTSKLTNQFQISDNGTPITWPAVNINFTGSPGPLKAGIADHSILYLFGDVYTEFWQNAGSPDFPYALISGSTQEFGLAAPWSLAKFDNSVVGIFTSKMGGIIVGRLSGFSIQKISDEDLDTILDGYSDVSDARGCAFTIGGHPMYLLNLSAADAAWVYDGASGIWSRWEDATGARFWGEKYATFQRNLCISDRRNGNIYFLDLDAYSDNGSVIPVELRSHHLWDDDKYIGISRIQIDMESGTGNPTGQGSNPVLDLQVSKDGGNTFYSVGFASFGAIGAYTQRVLWNSLGAARDWVLKLRSTDPVKTVITGASAEFSKGSF
jgi:hypothetical protein